jgi:hypothetical protein
MSFGWALGVMVCVSIVINPISWTVYLVLTLIPAAQVLHWLRSHRFPVRETNAALLVAIVLLVPFTLWVRLALASAGYWSMPAGGEPVLPLASALFLRGPALGVVALGGLTALLGWREHARQRTRLQHQDGGVEPASARTLAW